MLGSTEIQQKLKVEIGHLTLPENNIANFFLQLDWCKGKSSYSNREQ